VAALAALAAGLPPGAAPAGLGVAALRALASPAGAWPVLVAALGLAAAGLAPATVLGAWRERLDPGALSGGAALGGAVFGVLAALRLADVPAGSWIGWLTAWPAVAALPLNALVTWLASAGPRPSPRAPLPAGFAELHGGDRS
jgi:Na+(H+)/acetate symporter ActP